MRHVDPSAKGYYDEKTGMSMTIEQDIPEWPRITCFPPPIGKHTEGELYDAIGRLIKQAKDDGNWSQPQEEKEVPHPSS